VARGTTTGRVGISVSLTLSIISEGSCMLRTYFFKHEKLFQHMNKTLWTLRSHLSDYFQLKHRRLFSRQVVSKSHFLPNWTQLIGKKSTYPRLNQSRIARYCAIRSCRGSGGVKQVRSGLSSRRMLMRVHPTGRLLKCVLLPMAGAGSTCTARAAVIPESLSIDATPFSKLRAAEGSRF